MRGKKILAAVLLATCVFSATSASAAYSPMSEAFVSSPIDGTTRWGSPVKSGGTFQYPTINSKWCEVRTTGTSPHVGVDLAVGKTYDVVAVTAGNLKRDRNDTTFNTTSLSTSKANVYCHYEHMLVADIKPDGYYAQGDKVGVPGNAGAALHLHFGAYDKNTLSGRKSYRTETLYRNAAAWDYGRHVDVFSQVNWMGNGIAQITVSFSGATNDHTERPNEVRVFYRKAGTVNWLDGGAMTNVSEYRYQYDFKNVLASGTSFEWTARITRNKTISSGNTIFAPAKFYNPPANPNATSAKYACFSNVV